MSGESVGLKELLRKLGARLLITLITLSRLFGQILKCSFATDESGNAHGYNFLKTDESRELGVDPHVFAEL